MCQAYDGERAYLVAQERLERERQSARLSLFDEMREALVEFMEITAPAARLPTRDPDYHAEVKALGDRIGYGAMMLSAQAAWRDALKEDGLEGGEHTHGAAYAVLMGARKMAEAVLSKLSAMEGKDNG